MPSDSLPQSDGSLSRQPFGGADSYLRYVMSAQQELLQLSLNFLQREIQTGKRIAASGNVGDAMVAWNDLATSTIDDYTAATARLMRLATGLGTEVGRDAEEFGSDIAQTARKGAYKAVDQATSLAENPLREVIAATSSTLRRSGKR
jgi:hypothetical protein